MRLPLLMTTLAWTLLACGDPAATPAPDASTADAPQPDAAQPDAGEPDTADAQDGPDTAAPDAGGDTTDPADGQGGKRDWDAAFAHVLPADHVVDLRLQFAPGAWAQLLETWQQKKQKAWHAAGLSFDGEVVGLVGARLKGLNSLNIPDSGAIDPAGRYPLKVDFNREGGARYHGVDKLSLNTSGNDPSRMRDWLTARMYEAMGVAAARIAWAEVRIDGALVGPYVLAQAIDKRFLKHRFGTEGGADDGNLYKCVYNQFGACSLQWLGNSKADYLRTDACAEGYGQCGLVLQTNEDDPAKNDYQDLIGFLDVLHHTPDAELPAKLPAVFDVDHFLKLAAVAYATSNFDSYFGKGHNYYLYRRADGRFQMIPWDFDLAYGNTQCPGDIADPTCGNPDGHPLTQRILAVPAWREQYLTELRAVAEQWLTPEQHAAWIAQADALLAPVVAKDPQPPKSPTYAEQIAPQGQAEGNLHRFVAERRAFILANLPPAK